MANDPRLKLHQIIYASMATHPFSADELEELLALARRNNQSVNVSGALIYHDDCFLQVLEGPQIAVRAIFNRIGTDPRHGHVWILLDREIEEREFEDWSMAFIDSSGHAKQRSGFVDYVSQFENLATDKSRAHKVLSGFREGQWRLRIGQESAA